MSATPQVEIQVDGVARVFRVPDGGGYVRERVGSEWVQVCERLYHTGQALSCKPEALERIIEREARARARAERMAQRAR